MKERKVFLCLGSNREIPYCTMEAQARRPQDYGRPVFAVETIEQAKALQVYFCALNRDGSGRYHFVDKNTRDVDAEDVWKNGSFPTMVIKAFDAHFDNHYGGPEQIPQTLAEIEHRECRDHPGETYTADTPCPACKEARPGLPCREPPPVYLL